MLVTFLAVDYRGTVIRHRAATISLGYSAGILTGFALQGVCGETARVDQLPLIGHETLPVTCDACRKGAP